MLGKANKIPGRDRDNASHGTIALAMVGLCVLCLCVACVLTFEPSEADATEFSDENFNYTTISDTEVEISSLVDESKTAMPTIPSKVTHEGTEYKVTAIGDYAFYLLDNLTGTVTVPKDIRTIGWKSFEGAGITGLVFADGSELTTIGYRAFNGCPLTGTVTIPSKVTTIGDTAFYMAKMTAVEFAASDAELTIEGSAFGKCTNLASITIPTNVKSIGNRAFNGCSSLTEVTFTDDGNAKLESLGNYTFYDCGSLTGTIAFPSSLESIGSSCFKGTNITGITIPNDSKLETVGDYAFDECASLGGTVAFPQTIREIGPYSFTSTSITGVTFATPSAGVELTIGNGAFKKCSALACTITFPASLTSLGEFSFTESAVTGISFGGEGPETIGTYTFRNCGQLTGTLTVPSGTKTIEMGAFSNSGLTGLDLSGASSLETIGDAVFLGCNDMSVAKLTIPSSVTKISDAAFFSGPKITALEFAEGSKVATLGEAAFDGCDIKGVVSLPNSLKLVADMCFMGNADITGLVIDLDSSELTTIMDSAFSGCALTGNMNIPKGLTNIGSQAFKGCDPGLKFTVNEDNPKYSTNGEGWLMSDNGSTVVFAPGAAGSKTLTGVKKIGDGAFSGTGLTSVTFDRTLTDIGNFAFDGCRGLTGTITFPATLRTIGAGAFTGTEITTIEFAEGSVLGSIGNNAFKGLDSLVCDLILPASVTRIGDAAFSVTGITSLGFEEDSKLVVICNDAFKNCKSLLSVEIPASVTDIDSEAFSRCTYLTTVEFGEGSKIEFIGDGAFMGCNGLSWIRFPSTERITQIGENVFTHNGEKPGQTLFLDRVGGTAVAFNMENKDRFSGNLYSKDSMVISDPLTRTCAVTVEYGFTEDDVVEVFAGAVMDRPVLPETDHYVCTGWYCNGLLWDFGTDTVEKDMTVVLKYSEIDEKGKIHVSTATTAEIDFSKAGLKDAHIGFSEGAAMDIAKNGCTEKIVASMFAGDGKYRVIVDGSYSESVTITVPYDASKGTPEVYQYVDGNKVKMQCDIDDRTHTVVFRSAEPADGMDATYGVEYVSSSGMNTTLMLVLMVVVILAAGGVFYYTRKH